MKLTAAQRRALTGHHVAHPTYEFWAGRDQRVNARTADSLVKLGLAEITFAGGPPSYPRSLMRVQLTAEGARLRESLCGETVSAVE